MAAAPLDLSNPKHIRADKRLHENVIMWLGSVRPDGRPHLVPVWFLWDAGTILLFSKPDQKIRNLRANPRVIISLDDTKGGNNVVLLEGEATLLPSGEISPAYAPYAAKYASLMAEFGWTGASMGKEYSEAIRITPTRFLAY